MAKRRKGTGCSDDDKKKEIADAIWRLRDPDGNVRPARVVEEARDPNSILHNEFEWRDEVLIRQQLEARAAELIKQCKSIVQYGERVILIPTYITVPRKKKTFAPTIAIAQNAALKTLALERELTGIRNAIHRAMSLAMVFSLENYFEQMLQQVADVESALMRDNGGGGGSGGSAGKGKGKGSKGKGKGRGRGRRDDDGDGLGPSPVI